MEGLDLLKIGEAIKIRRIKRRIHQTKLARAAGYIANTFKQRRKWQSDAEFKGIIKAKKDL